MPAFKPAPPHEVQVRLLPEDRQIPEVSRHLTPWEVDQMLREANTGDCRAQAKLAQEILEKDWDMAQALQTRAAAVLGSPWTIEPAPESRHGREVAEFVAAALRGAGQQEQEPALVGFAGLLSGLLSAYLPGYAVAEIVWRAGGAGISGFQVLPAHHFRFGEGSWSPLLVTADAPQGLALPANKFIVHSYRQRSGDPARGGLIRPLAWLYVFKNLALKDLLRYIEKYGMPFIAARLDEQAFEKERRKIAYLVRNFGSDGGGVFTKATELEMLHAPGSSGEVYFRFLEYCERAVARLILGQTSTSDSRDSNRSTAHVHNLVRQDLRTDDCGALAATLRRELIRPLVQFNYGPEEALPTLSFQAPVQGDREQESRIVANLVAAGYRLDPATVSARTGYPVLSGPEVTR